jgi:hypothetical protein
MPSDLQRVARGLVECLDEVPQVVAHLQRTAARCRENAAMSIAASRGQATTAAMQLDAAAQACEEAAHYLAMAPPKAKAWAERLVGSNRPSQGVAPGSPDRNPATSAVDGKAIETPTSERTAAPDDLPDTESDERDPTKLAIRKSPEPDESRAWKPLEPSAPVVEIAEQSVEPIDFKRFRQRLAVEGPTRPIVGDGPEMDFQRVHCGATEFRLTLDDHLPRAVWADGLDERLRHAQDAKYLEPTSTASFYRPGSLTPFMRKIAEEKNDHMLLKYREVINDENNPVEGLEIITNDLAAASYVADRLRELDIPGRVTVEQGSDS